VKESVELYTDRRQEASALASSLARSLSLSLFLCVCACVRVCMCVCVCVCVRALARARAHRHVHFIKNQRRCWSIHEGSSSRSYGERGRGSSSSLPVDMTSHKEQEGEEEVLTGFLASSLCIRLPPFSEVLTLLPGVCHGD